MKLYQIQPKLMKVTFDEVPEESEDEAPGGIIYTGAKKEIY